jgi:hypothetical protein
MAIEIVDFPMKNMKNGGSFHSFLWLRLPEGIVCNEALYGFTGKTMFYPRR